MLESTTVLNYLDALSSRAPVPGGGSVSALQGALCCALGCMVCNLTIGKSSCSSWDGENRELLRLFTQTRRRFEALSEEDMEAFQALLPAYRLPRRTEEERRERARVMDPLLERAAQVPLRVMEECLKALEGLERLRVHASAMAVSDVGAAAACARACLEGALLNVRVNAASMTGRDRAALLLRQGEELTRRGRALSEKLYADVANTWKEPG